ncbi:MAG: hypothetical protein NTW96_01195 [Planctomycetia bacterium]|nr:hypothetical protein [Planctomycetia bacterium]
MSNARWNLPGGKKDIQPIARRGSGWANAGMPKPWPLYRLTDLASATRVFVTEGEPAADAARSIGLVATTSPHGSKSAHHADWSPLAGKEIVILPDNDSDGAVYRDAVVGITMKLTPPATVRVVELPGLPPKGDIVDFLDAHDTVEPDALFAIARAIQSLADAVRESSQREANP